MKKRIQIVMVGAMLALVTTPSRWAFTTPKVAPLETPKSSALTTMAFVIKPNRASCVDLSFW